jgi:hypothetical protein
MFRTVIGAVLGYWWGCAIVSGYSAHGRAAFSIELGCLTAGAILGTLAAGKD